MQKTSVQIFRTRSRAQKIGYSVKEKLMNFLSSLLTRNEIRLYVTKKKSSQTPIRNSYFRASRLKKTKRSFWCIGIRDASERTQLGHHGPSSVESGNGYSVIFKDQFTSV